MESLFQVLVHRVYMLYWEPKVLNGILLLQKQMLYQLRFLFCCFSFVLKKFCFICCALKQIFIVSDAIAIRSYFMDLVSSDQFQVASNNVLRNGLEDYIEVVRVEKDRMIKVSLWKTF